MLFFGLTLWVVTAVVLWEHARKEDASTALRVIAVMVIMPLAMFIISYRISRAQRR